MFKHTLGWGCSLFQCLFDMRSAMLNESQRAWLRGKSKFSCLCCRADVRRIYPALGTFVWEGWPLFKRQWPRQGQGCKQRETDAWLLNGRSRRTDGGISQRNKSKAAASTLLKGEGQDNAPGLAWELPVRVQWSQQGLTVTSVPWEKDTALILNEKNERRLACCLSASKGWNPNRGWHCPHTCPAASVDLVMSWAGFRWITWSQGNC